MPVDVSSVIYAREFLTPEFIRELIPLLEAHWSEIDHADIPMAPDWAFYSGVEEAGMLRIYTVRSSGSLKGYCVFFVNRAPHSKGSTQARADLIYLDPEIRGRFVGSRFISWCTEQLRAEGVEMVYHTVNAKHDWGEILRRQGFDLHEYVYSKRLDQEAA
jgi:GNAT superfamily N-acetyltransferase